VTSYITWESGLFCNRQVFEDEHGYRARVDYLTPSREIVVERRSIHRHLAIWHAMKALKELLEETDDGSIGDPATSEAGQFVARPEHHRAAATRTVSDAFAELARMAGQGRHHPGACPRRRPEGDCTGSARTLRTTLGKGGLRRRMLSFTRRRESGDDK